MSPHRLLAVVALAALSAGQWVACPCSSSAPEVGLASPAASLDSHTCDPTASGLRSTTDCCQGMNRETTPATGRERQPIVLPVSAEETARPLFERTALPAATFVVATRRPPLLLVLRI